MTKTAALLSADTQKLKQVMFKVYTLALNFI